jgi:hypothetical protein
MSFTSTSTFLPDFSLNFPPPSPSIPRENQTQRLFCFRCRSENVLCSVVLPLWPRPKKSSISSSVLISRSTHTNPANTTKPSSAANSSIRSSKLRLGHPQHHLRLPHQTGPARQRPRRFVAPSKNTPKNGTKSRHPNKANAGAATPIMSLSRKFPNNFASCPPNSEISFRGV